MIKRNVVTFRVNQNDYMTELTDHSMNCRVPLRAIFRPDSIYTACVTKFLIVEVHKYQRSKRNKSILCTRDWTDPFKPIFKCRAYIV